MENDIDYDALTSSVTPPGVPCHVRVRGARTYNGDSYYVTLRLTEFRDSRVTSCDDPYTGECESGIFIPFRQNGLSPTSMGNVTVTFRMDVASVPCSKYTHVLTQVTDRIVSEERRRRGLPEPRFGFGRPVGKGYGSDSADNYKHKTRHKINNQP